MPGSQLLLGASDCAPELAVAAWPLGHLHGPILRNSSTTRAKAGRTAQVFATHGSTHRKTDTRVSKRILQTLACRGLLSAFVDRVSVRVKNARVEKVPQILNIPLLYKTGTACVSECVLKR